MARIAGVNLPLNKRIEIGLTYVHGVGRSTADKVLDGAGVDPDTYVKDLTEEETVKLRDAIEELEVEGDLRRDRSQNIKRLSEIGSYRGVRHRRGLPTRGQRTKTNARGRKGPRRMSVAGKKKPPSKK
jgi:small subunit ribosomal protein S13